MAEIGLKPNLIKDAAASVSQRHVRIGLQRESGFKRFFSNLHDFLFERPVKFRGGTQGLPFLPGGFGSGLGSNLKEWLSAAPKSARGPLKSGLLVSWASESSSFWDNVRFFFAAQKPLPKGANVPEIWTKDTQFTRVQALSLAIHVVVLVLILIPLLPEIMSPPTTKAGNVTMTPIAISDYVAKLPAGNKKAGGGGGGGEHSTVTASRGKLPKPSYTQLAPPSVHPPIAPRMQVPATVLAVPDIKLPSPNAPNYGDPLAKLITDSNGTGGLGGIGSGQGTGVGSGNGAGVGPGEGWNTGGGTPNAGENGYGTPECVYCPRAEFSDEAVKAKFQGSVLVQLVVLPDGRAGQVRVVQGVGLGLDEKAAEAVRISRFKPAIGPDGKPAAVRMLIEVQFNLY